MSTQYQHRFLIIIPAARRDAMANWWTQNIDPLDKGQTFSIGLNASGRDTDAITHYWCCTALTAPQVRQVMTRLCVLAGVTVPSDIAGYSRAQITSWITSRLPLIAQATGIRVKRDDNDGQWSDYHKEASDVGLKPRTKEQGPERKPAR